MALPTVIVFYVSDIARSQAFYSQILEQAPAETSPAFVMFALPTGIFLGLWARSTVLPPTDATAGASELVLGASDRAQVDALYKTYQSRAIPILQAPIDLEFGYNFVLQDPDGHRLRVLFASGPSAK